MHGNLHVKCIGMQKTRIIQEQAHVAWEKHQITHRKFGIVLAVVHGNLHPNGGFLKIGIPGHRDTGHGQGELHEG